MSTANDLTQLAKEEFLRKNSNLLALTREGATGVFKRISASLALDQKAQDDVLFYADTIDQQDSFARNTARNDFKQAMYVAICKAFLKIQHNYVVEFVSKFTPEAEAEYEAIEIAAALKAAAPPPPPQKNAREQLEDQVREDWRKLPTDKMKIKLNNREYKATFDRLMAANQLDSQCTQLHDGGEWK